MINSLIELTNTLFSKKKKKKKIIHKYIILLLYSENRYTKYLTNEFQNID